LGDGAGQLLEKRVIEALCQHELSEIFDTREERPLPVAKLALRRGTLTTSSSGSPRPNVTILTNNSRKRGSPTSDY
jgi:hypothetical protein